jgi:arylsulfatase A-like enzyme
MLFASLLVGCTSSFDPGDKDGRELGPPTDTFPSFYGQVPRNLLMVSIDTLRRDLLLRYGADQEYFPFLEDIAENGVVVDHHRSCSDWTFSSVLCVTNGSSNIELGYMPDLNHSTGEMAPDGHTLATRLADDGWNTALVTSNSWFSSDRNSDVGFQSSQRPDDRSTNSVFTMGEDDLRDLMHEDAPWYVHLHIKEPHPPYNPPEQYRQGEDDLPPVPYDLSSSDDQYEADSEWPDMTDEERENLLEHLLLRYHGEVAWMSDELTDHFGKLRSMGALDDTLVVFWSDHGEQFWEHGEQSHAYGLNREENDSILIFWAKNIVPDTWDEPTSHPDITPTVLSLFGEPLTDDLTGVPIGTADPERPLDFAAIARLGPIQSVVKDGWKLIYRWNTGSRELYDTVNDPEELQDVYAADDPHAVELEEILQPRVEAMQPLTDLYTPH